ncbi:MAG: hypothetical protein ACK5HR_02290 [Mycoplasmatales bacterium]
MKKPYIKKYRKSIVEAMDEEKTKKYGFEKAYFIFERSINRLVKEGDEAEAMAVEYLKQKNLLSSNYSLNRVIALNTIKIEADIIDFDNKIIYETKSRRTGKLAKQAVIKKWRVFEYDKYNSNYENFQFKGIVVANYEDGKQVKGIVNFENKKLDNTHVKQDFEKYYAKLEEFKLIKREPKHVKQD